MDDGAANIRLRCNHGSDVKKDNRESSDMRVRITFALMRAVGRK